MTRAEFLAWEPTDPSVYAWELQDGEPVAKSYGNRNHGTLKAELGSLLRNHALDHDLPVWVLLNPVIAPDAWDDRTLRIPDIGMTRAPPSDPILVEAPLFIAEILSAEEGANVWTYATIPSVTEILVVHSKKVAAELLRRGADGQWPEQPIALGADDSITLTSVDFTVPLRALYRTTVLAVS